MSNEQAEIEAKAARKAAKRAAKEAAAAAEGEEAEVDEEEAKRQRKAAKKAAKQAAAEAEAAAAAKEEEDAAEAKKQRKAAKKAAKEAAAAAEEGEEAAPEKKKKKKREAEEEAEAEEEPKPKKKKVAEEDAAEAPAEDAKPEKSMKLFIKGFPYSVSEDQFKKDFAECGEIVHLQFPTEEGKTKGFAFLTFATQEGVDAAMKFDNTDYGGRYITVSPANDGGSGKAPKGKGKGEKGKGKTKEGDWTCPNCGDNVFARNSACRSCGTPKPGGGIGCGETDTENQVFIRGLPFSVTEEQMRKDFAECGEIQSSKFPINEEGRPRGIAFIKFVTKEGFDAAIKFDNTDYGGRTINVCKSGENKGEGKGKSKDGKDGKGKGKDGKGKGKGKGKKGKAPSEAQAKSSGCIVEGTGEKKTFSDSDDE